jgi:hypothetical protein
VGVTARITYVWTGMGDAVLVVDIERDVSSLVQMSAGRSLIVAGVAVAVAVGGTLVAVEE